MAILVFDKGGNSVEFPTEIKGIRARINESVRYIGIGDLAVFSGFSHYRGFYISLDNIVGSGKYYDYSVFRIGTQLDNTFCGLIYTPYYNVERQIANEHGIPEDWLVERKGDSTLYCHDKGGGFIIKLTPQEQSRFNFTSSKITPNRDLIRLLSNGRVKAKWIERILKNYEQPSREG
jgi:hypothetical protein